MALDREEIAIGHLSDVDVPTDFQMMDIFSLGHEQGSFAGPDEGETKRWEKTIRGYI